MLLQQKTLENIEKSITELEQHGLSFEDILNLIKKQRQQKTNIPLSIFNKKLSSLESIVKYLKENGNLNYKNIALLLNRNYNPIRITYKNSKNKLRKDLDVSSKQSIPINIFSNKKFSILENLVSYLKDSLKFSYHEIAIILNRDDRTIWTIYSRYKNKK